eukprot:294905_1
MSHEIDDKVHKRIMRCYEQKMFVIDENDAQLAGRTYAVLGVSGNLYSVTISNIPLCSCPDFSDGNRCKHIYFMLLKVLNIDKNSPLLTQDLFSPEEITQIFETAPSRYYENENLATEEVRTTYAHMTEQLKEEAPRRPIKDEKCCVCYDDLDEGDISNIVFCKSRCGKNIHSRCMEVWAQTKRENNREITCPHCRTPCGDDMSKKVDMPVSGGFYNFARQQGIQTHRATQLDHLQMAQERLEYRRVMRHSRPRRRPDDVSRREEVVASYRPHPGGNRRQRRAAAANQRLAAHQGLAENPEDNQV